ncbi:hypothetical protein B0H17DRAFT_1094140, partial [Mycena rosella]
MLHKGFSVWVTIGVLTTAGMSLFTGRICPTPAPLFAPSRSTWKRVVLGVCPPVRLAGDCLLRWDLGRPDHEALQADELEAHR